MEQYRVGQNVQAIGELGRCAEGNVADITEDGVEITLCGWGQENNVVLKPSCGGISAPIHPFQCAVDVNLFSAWTCESCHRVTIGDLCSLGDLDFDTVVFNITGDTNRFKSYVKGRVKTNDTDDVVVQAAVSKVMMKLASKQLAKEGLKKVKSHRRVIYEEFQQ